MARWVPWAPGGGWVGGRWVDGAGEAQGRGSGGEPREGPRGGRQAGSHWKGPGAGVRRGGTGGPGAMEGFTLRRSYCPFLLFSPQIRIRKGRWVHRGAQGCP